jgi:hypothetical protein
MERTIHILPPAISVVGSKTITDRNGNHQATTPRRRCDPMLRDPLLLAG